MSAATENSPGLSFNQGRAYLYIKGHPRGNNRGYVLRAIVIAERALGKPLPLGAEVHHVDEDKANDNPGNHVLCQDRAYHALLGMRTRALKACGHANWIKCRHCKRWDAPEKLYIPKSFHTSGAHHRDCHAAYEFMRKHHHVD